jgi:hypothetical protein
MTLPIRTIPRTQLLGAAAIAVFLAIPGVASGKAGEATFQHTYPVASRLCANTAAGKESRRLKLFATQVLADCTTLQSGFTAAQTAVLAARATITPQIAADRKKIDAACPTPADQHPACVGVRAHEGAAIEVLKHQMVLAAHHYYRSIEMGRVHFWRAISALPGEAHIHEDAPVPISST